MGRNQEAKLEALTDEIRTLSGRVAELQGEKDYLDKTRVLTEDVTRLREDIETLKIEKLRLTEEHDRDGRETLHKVGLERMRQEFEGEQKLQEIEVAKREALVEVREDNLTAEREAFESQMKFITERFSKENDYVRKIMESILKRLPDVNVELGRAVGSDVSDG